ncbi:primary-amine oxidase [Arthrobacter sp. NPDC058127]|uniref:primary-amine oxidase n=1 Tax=Arthrobacter sp. NPDC058127 TaxID=3346351 RepID=UPI0036ED371A
MTTSSAEGTTQRLDLIHPLSRLSAEEVDVVREVVADSGLLMSTARFVYIGLEEPHKNTVLNFTSGDRIERLARVFLLDRSDGTERDLIVSITGRTIVRNDILDTATAGHVPILDEEFETVEEIVRQDPRWIAALERRGLSIEQVRAVPLSAGSFGFEDERGERYVRVVGFAQKHPTDMPWGHPVDGLVAYVNLRLGAATQIIDDEVLPVPSERSVWNDEPHARLERTTLKPIEITQPEGPSFTVVDDVIDWENWNLRVGFDMREGLILHQVGFAEGERLRPIIYRASIAEMVVNYADPNPTRFYQNYFDTGEYLFSRYTNSLQLGCDCLGEIHYLDAMVPTEAGEPRTLKNAICIHEEDYGVLWKHNDMFNGMSETRRQRRLVVSFFTTIGNYDYGFYWYFYLDGTIELEVKATGVVFANAFRGEDDKYATEMAPGLGAPFHQHLFSARLDMMVDGPVNAVDEVEAVRLPVSPENPYGNAFTRSITRLKRESEAQRLAEGSTGRVWHIVNPEVKNRLGRNVAYALHPENQPVMLSDESSSVHKRATFATRSLWVTQYDPAERYPAGDFVNQHPGGAGLPSFVAADRDVDGQDIVLWHTFGLTHFPRPEDWPIMPVDYAGFKLKPVGFFDRNPALDVPGNPGRHCHG